MIITTVITERAVIVLVSSSKHLLILININYVKTTQKHVLISERSHTRIKNHHKKTGVPVWKIMEDIIDTSSYFKKNIRKR